MNNKRGPLCRVEKLYVDARENFNTNYITFYCSTAIAKP